MKKLSQIIGYDSWGYAQPAAPSVPTSPSKPLPSTLWQKWFSKPGPQTRIVPPETSIGSRLIGVGTKLAPWGIFAGMANEGNNIKNTLYDESQYENKDDVGNPLKISPLGQARIAKHIGYGVTTLGLGAMNPYVTIPGAAAAITGSALEDKYENDNVISWKKSDAGKYFTPKDMNSVPERNSLHDSYFKNIHNPRADREREERTQNNRKDFPPEFNQRNLEKVQDWYRGDSSRLTKLFGTTNVNWNKENIQKAYETLPKDILETKPPDPPELNI